MSTYLAGRRVGRSPGTGFAAALLLLLAMGLLVVSTSYRAIVLRNHADAAHTQVGADWNVQVSPPEQVLAAIGDLPEEATAVVRTEPTFSDGSFSLPPTVLGIDPATYEEGGWWRSDFSSSSLEDIVEGLATDPLGLPVDAGTLTLALDVPVLPQGMLVQATEFDDAGQVRTVEAPLRGGFRLLRPRSGRRPPRLDHVPRRHRDRAASRAEDRVPFGRAGGRSRSRSRPGNRSPGAAAREPSSPTATAVPPSTR